MIPSVKIDIFFILPLIFTILLAKRHVKENQDYKFFIFGSLLTICLLLLDIASIEILRETGQFAIHCNKAINVLGFALGPSVPYVIFYFITSDTLRKKHRLLIIIPLVANVLLSIFSYQTGWLFSVNDQNLYSRGPLFLLNPSICLFYFFIDIYASLQYRGHNQKSPSFYLVLIYCLPVAAVALQYIFPDVLVIWGSVSLVLLMYYVYTLEKHFSYDALTNIENRESFEMEMYSLQRNHKKEATLIIFDLNNLKRTNDTYGHTAGDEMLRSTARLLATCFAKVGNIYRIGGDEFCVICKALPAAEAKRLLLNLQEKLDRQNKENKECPLVLAYGYATSNKNFGLGIDETLSKADNLMYEHKSLIKMKQQQQN
ncbi:diguanylate cyclase (GGDEF) domain-containing protein [Sphaerochaeta pleomorpha str. Grapes]|uniref:diguanylate cyclase n=1 Tax=Sphaerochaeta pleomorpha (strain ATCC BAA-1885 / DSM 22778 / Grapes) TaxID=158190 RepID=G8QQ57_SPHPG|nr:GGDEF domain-containing protein [Sphaerochaeta pleomorpha]AEV28634.1 diguanylate cyclase (GGDEF) domain-containing protein [Sphaerochaeta pleomorpha str. Grapes]